MDNEWQVHAPHNASNAALEVEAIRVATHICALLHACFDTKAIETWFLAEAQKAVEAVTWNSSQQRVESLFEETQDEIDAPSHA